MGTSPFLWGHNLLQTAIIADITGNNTVIPAVSGQIIHVYKMFCTTINATASVVFQNGATALTGTMEVGALTFDYDGEPWFTTSAGNAFIINIYPARQLSGRIYYTQQ